MHRHKPTNTQRNKRANPQRNEPSAVVGKGIRSDLVITIENTKHAPLFLFFVCLFVWLVGFLLLLLFFVDVTTGVCVCVKSTVTERLGLFLNRLPRQLSRHDDISR